MASEPAPDKADAEALWVEPTDKQWKELMEVLPRPRADFLPDFLFGQQKAPPSPKRRRG